ncbi:MAG TPA: HAD-IIIA family hydrolase [Symbiobacteriaceae bacterium]|nr:HAD-IIIA family hydrolase [Symbiobacteriaceae bacterium]
MNLQAVFLDRDGTLGGTGHFVHPRDFTPYPWTTEALHLLKQSSCKVFAFTNQHRISRGEATAAEFAEQFLSYGLDGTYLCPHGIGEGCSCQKPAPGLLYQAAEEHGLDLTRCAVIGDVGATDMLAAAAVGARKILVRTGWGEDSLGAYRHMWAEVEPDYIATDLLDAVKWLLHTERPRA